MKFKLNIFGVPSIYLQNQIKTEILKIFPNIDIVRVGSVVIPPPELSRPSIKHIVGVGVDVGVPVGVVVTAIIGVVVGVLVGVGVIHVTVHAEYIGNIPAFAKLGLKQICRLAVIPEI
jgi:hypothetical protein